MSTADQTSSETSARQYPRATAPDAYRPDDTSSGWVSFAGVMLMILATINIIDGIAAVSNSTFFTANAKFVISGLNTWGWILIFCGVGQGLVALGIWARTKGVRWIGVGIAALNAIIQLLFIPAYPFWSLALFTLDILVIYGLIAHGKRVEA